MLRQFFFVFLVTNTILANPILNDQMQQLQDYITIIQSQIDETVKPCENFGKYACGQLQDVMYSEPAVPDVEQLLEEHLSTKKPEANYEKLASTFYLSCKNGGDITKLFGQVDALKSITTWPVTENYNDDEIARLFGDLATVYNRGLLSINIEDFIEDNIIHIQLGNDFHVGELENALVKFNPKLEENLITVENITNFIEECKNIIRLQNKETVPTEFKNVAALKEVMPNFIWDTYFNTIANSFKFTNFLEKPIRIRNFEQFQKIIDIIQNKDSRTIVNYLIWRYVEIGLSIKCNNLLQNFSPLYVSKQFGEDSSNEIELQKFFKGQLEILQNFEKSYATIKSQLNNPESDKINEIIKLKKHAFENYINFFSGNFLVELFSEFEMSDNALYSNVFNMLRATFKDFISNSEHGNFVVFGDFLSTSIGHYIKDNNINIPKTMLHNYVSENTELWMQTMRIDDIYKNRIISDDCLPYENNTNNDQNRNYLNAHAAYHIALQDYLQFVDEHKDQFEKETEIMTASVLNHAKVYMLALAQETCSVSKTKDLDDHDLLWFFKHSKDFSDAWGCAPEDEMNKICDESTFIPNFKKSA